MKKIIIIALVFIVLALSGAFVFLVPYGFHMLVHKMVIPEIQELKGKVNYETLTRDHHQSTFMLDGSGAIRDYKIEVGTLTFLNPMENHVKVNFTNTLDIKRSYEFKIYFQLTPGGELRFNVKTQDIELTDNAGNINLKGVDIFFGSFDDDDLEIAKEKPDDILRLLENKDITVHIDEVNADSNEAQYLVKDVEFMFKNTVDDNELTLLSSVKAGEYNGVVENKPVFSKSSQGTFSFGKLDAKKAIEFFKNLADKKNPMMGNPMFLAMSAMGMINFPLNLEIKSRGHQDQGEVVFNVDAELKNKNVMDLNNVDVEVYHKNLPEYLTTMLVQILAGRYTDKEAAKFEGGDNFKDPLKIKKTITDTVTAELMNRTEDLYKFLVEEKVFIQEQSFYIIDFKLKSAKANIGELQMEVSEFFALPHQLVIKFFDDPSNPGTNQLDEALKAAGLTRKTN